MKRKLALLVLASAVTFSCVLSGCGKNKSANDNDAASDSSDADMSQQSITLINSKSEVSDQISELASAYRSETGVTVNVINIPSGVDAQATVKGLYLSD